MLCGGRAGSPYNRKLHCPYCAAPIEILTAACSFCGAATLIGDRYEIHSRLGRGGMSEVFRARDRRLDTDVAIKRLPPQFAGDPTLRASLQREAQIMARLSDATFVRMYDLEEHSGHLYLILEYVPGPSVAAMIRAGYRATLPEARRILGDLCRGLATAHKIGILHRDLKPSNLIVSLEGEERVAFEASQQLPADLSRATVKIADFGIAKAVRESGATFTGEFAGTPGYTAPEQLQGATLTPAADVYSLGALTCELLTGAAPRGRQSIGELPALVGEVVAQATVFDPAYRFQSAAAFYSALVEAIEGRSAVPTIASTGRRRSSPLRAIAVLGIAVAIFVAIGAVAYLMEKRRPVRTTVIPLEQPDREPLPEFRIPPRVDALPPVVAAARGRVGTKTVTGPAQPKMAWELRLPATSTARVVALAADGTVVLKGVEHLYAVRDGKFQWGVKAASVQDLRLDEDGRIWWNAPDQLFCLNTTGDGGRVALESPAPPRPGMAVRCTFGRQIRGKGWNVPVESGCAPAGVVEGQDGVVYAATEDPEILAVKDGAIVTRTAVSCTPQSMIVAGPERLVFQCRDSSLHSLQRGKETWQAKPDGRIYSNLIADVSGNVYYGDTSEVGESHVHSLDAAGRVRWTYSVGRMPVHQVTLDSRGGLLVSGALFRARLIALHD